jgi:hypothetical protein
LNRVSPVISKAANDETTVTVPHEQGRESFEGLQTAGARQHQQGLAAAVFNNFEGATGYLNCPRLLRPDLGLGRSDRPTQHCCDTHSFGDATRCCDRPYARQAHQVHSKHVPGVRPGSFSRNYKASAAFGISRSPHPDCNGAVARLCTGLAGMPCKFHSDMTRTRRIIAALYLWEGACQVDQSSLLY